VRLSLKLTNCLWRLAELLSGPCWRVSDRASGQWVPGWPHRRRPPLKSTVAVLGRTTCCLMWAMDFQPIGRSQRRLEWTYGPWSDGGGAEDPQTAGGRHVLKRRRPIQSNPSVRPFFSSLWAHCLLGELPSEAQAKHNTSQRHCGQRIPPGEILPKSNECPSNRLRIPKLPFSCTWEEGKERAEAVKAAELLQSETSEFHLIVRGYGIKGRASVEDPFQSHSRKVGLLVVDNVGRNERPFGACHSWALCPSKSA